MGIANDNQNLNRAFAALQHENKQTSNSLKSSFIKHANVVTDQRVSTTLNITTDNLIKLYLLKDELHIAKLSSTFNEIIQEVYKIVFETDTISDEQLTHIHDQLPVKIQKLIDQQR